MATLLRSLCTASAQRSSLMAPTAVKRGTKSAAGKNVSAVRQEQLDALQAKFPQVARAELEKGVAEAEALVAKERRTVLGSDPLENEVLKWQGKLESASLADFLEEAKKNPELSRTIEKVKRAAEQALGDGTGLYVRTEKPPVRVAVTGAAGAIGYALLFRIASGEMLGKDQPVILQLLELPAAQNALTGVAMELDDAAFPLLKGIVKTDDANKAFAGADYALLVGAKPRSKGMERKDLLKENASIFSVQGKAINANAADGIRVLVVGNPANTNALIASSWATRIAKNQFSAMTRLDENRGLAQLAQKLNVATTAIDNFCIWGNHSATQYPDISHALVQKKKVGDLVRDDKWVRETFIPTVQQRGAAIIAARGSSSAASAASAAIDHMRDWSLGSNGRWVSMAVPSDGSYGVLPGLIYSFPVVTEAGRYSVVPDLSIDAFSRERMNATETELIEEFEGVRDLLGPGAEALGKAVDQRKKNGPAKK